MSAPRRIVSVLSATGTQGTSVTKALSASGKFDVRALTRDIKSEKAQEIAKLPNTTLVSASNLEEAFKNAHAIYAYSFTGPEEVDYMKNVANIAEKAGVELFIYSSLPSAKEESNGKYSTVGHFERKQEVQKYIRTLKMKSVIVHLPAFADNFSNFGLVSKDGDKLNAVLSFAGTGTNLPMVNVETDLGEAISLILQNYEKNPSLLESPVPITSYKIPFGDHAEIIKKVTGKEVEVIAPPSASGGQNKEFDQMREFFDNVGMFSGKQLPDPRLTAIGYKPHDFEYFVRNTIVPTLGLN